MVKPHWDTEELIENWTLLPTELELVKNKMGGNQIGFALLLKHFQLFARFPDEESSIPTVVISYLASQLNLPENLYSDYDWQGRSAKAYRVEIRRLFNFRVATVQDTEHMNDWLIQEILPDEQKIESLREIVDQRFRDLQLEPITPLQVDRLVRSAIHQYEAHFCTQTFSQLSPDSIKEIDLLLTTEETESLENEELDKSHSAFCIQRSQEITDNLIDLLIQIIQRLGTRAERRINTELISDFTAVTGKTNLLFRIAEAAIAQPSGVVENVIYPVVSQKTLKDLVAEYKATGTAYLSRVHTVMRASFASHYRRMIPQLLSVLEFRSNNDIHRPVIRALELLKKYADSKARSYDQGEDIPIAGVIKSNWKEIIIETDSEGGENYQDLLYVRRRYIQKDQLRSAIAEVINAIFEIRLPHIWGEGTTTCASDSKHFGAWEQNLMTQYHRRYGGRGVMIYWHVEKKSTHLLQICLVYVNTLMIQSILSQKHWEEKLTATDLRAITPLIFNHVNPYGTFKLDLSERISRLTPPSTVQTLI